MTKHHLDKSSKLSFEQAANYALAKDLGKSTICSVHQLDDNTVEIVKRYPVKLGFSYNILGFDKRGLYERVTINRAEKTVAIDRIDANWWINEPFMGRRDMFFLEQRGSKPEQMAFVRMDYWRSSLVKFPAQMWSFFSARSYKRAF